MRTTSHYCVREKRERGVVEESSFAKSAISLIALPSSSFAYCTDCSKDSPWTYMLFKESHYVNMKLVAELVLGWVRGWRYSYLCTEPASSIRFTLFSESLLSEFLEGILRSRAALPTYVKEEYNLKTCKRLRVSRQKNWPSQLKRKCVNSRYAHCTGTAYYDSAAFVQRTKSKIHYMVR